MASAAAIVARHFLAIGPFPHQLGISQDAGQRVVDLVRQHRGHLPDRGHLLGVQSMLVGALEFACFMLHTLFQGVGPGDILVMLCLQLAAHAR